MDSTKCPIEGCLRDRKRKLRGTYRKGNVALNLTGQFYEISFLPNFFSRLTNWSKPLFLVRYFLQAVLRIQTTFVQIRLWGFKSGSEFLITKIWIILNSKFFLSCLNFLCRIYFVKIQIVWFHSQFSVSYSEYVGYITKNIYLISDRIRIRPKGSDPDPELQHCSQEYRYCLN